MFKHYTLVIVIGFILLNCLETKAQGLTFGIRAGLNYSKFLGEKTPEESFGLNNGFHFGINVGYKISDVAYVRSEILYNQQGSTYNYSGQGFYFFNIPTNNRFVIRDSTNLKLDISNAYVSFPLTVHLSVVDKWEFHAGAYINFLVSPVGAGTWRFGSREQINYLFEQGLNYSYNNDLPGEQSRFANSILLIVDGQDANVPSLVGAYYLQTEDRGDLINKLDYGLTGGVSYFLNRGLYLGLKGWYGFRDVTNNNVDYSLRELNADNTFIYSDDFDRNFSLDVSIGFKF